MSAREEQSTGTFNSPVFHTNSTVDVGFTSIYDKVSDISMAMPTTFCDLGAGSLLMSWSRLRVFKFLPCLTKRMLEILLSFTKKHRFLSFKYLFFLKISFFFNENLLYDAAFKQKYILKQCRESILSSLDDEHFITFKK